MDGYWRGYGWGEENSGTEVREGLDPEDTRVSGPVVPPEGVQRRLETRRQGWTFYPSLGQGRTVRTRSSRLYLMCRGCRKESRLREQKEECDVGSEGEGSE